MEEIKKILKEISKNINLLEKQVLEKVKDGTYDLKYGENLKYYAHWDWVFLEEAIVENKEIKLRDDSNYSVYHLVERSGKLKVLEKLLVIAADTDLILNEEEENG